VSTAADRPGGLLGSLRRLGASLLEIVHTRFELLVTELEEERAHIARALWLAAIGAVCLAASVILLVAFVVVLFWDSYRLQAIFALALSFGVAGILTLLALRNLVAERKRLFAQSLAELRTDRDRLEP
jgi:uncharacterized membrane protein YqjE